MYAKATTATFPKLRPARTVAEKMIKVDHAGENGAVNIYRAQRLVAQVRAPSLCGQLAEFQQHEESHRRIFAAHLEKIGVRRCVSYHLSAVGGYALGFVTGLIGPSAIAATTFAVEHVVLRHLEEQLDYLRTTSPDARDCVTQIYEDERRHHDIAEDHLVRDGWMTRVLIAVVQFSTEQVIRIGMR
ncbi:MAG TPA: demethoxyubiquinone hydroxylase family protein [Rhizomicrobium sp.]|nr:demethoxyubiquinone hydroxylase family protein [Rhizomicrobium sp.]